MVIPSTEPSAGRRIAWRPTTPNAILRMYLFSLLFFVGALAHGAHAQSTEPPPNIILLMADDQGWGDVGYRGHPHLKTPNLDAMAANGAQFSRFYAASAVCSPTRGSVMTGRHPMRYGICHANCGHIRPRRSHVRRTSERARLRHGPLRQVAPGYAYPRYPGC